MRLRSIAASLLLFICTSSLGAQSSEPEVPIQRLELGVQYVYLGTDTCYYVANCERPPAVAFGPALAVNVTRHFAVDASFNTTVQTQQPPADFEYGVIAGGRGTALMAGPRFELRRPKYGLFIFGQAGYQSWSQAPGPFLAVPYQGGFYISRAAPERQTFFASGGGLGGEYTPRLVFICAPALLNARFATSRLAAAPSPAQPATRRRLHGRSRRSFPPAYG